jgi:hypothetical protein
MSRSNAPGAEPLLSSRGRRIVLAVGFVSVLATVAALLYGSRVEEPEGRGRDSFSSGALGHRALFETLGELGFRVTRVLRGRYGEVRVPLLLLEPDVEGSVGSRKYALGNVLRRRADEGRVSIVVLPKWKPARGPAARARAEPASEEEVREVLHAVFSEPPKLRRPAEPSGKPVSTSVDGPLGRFDVQLPRPQMLQPTGNVEVLASGEQGALVVRDPQTGTYVVSDPDVAHSFNLHRADHAALWHAMLRELGTDAVALDEVLHGHGEVKSLARALGRFPAVLIVVHLLLLGFAAVMAGSKRFGPPRPPRSPYQRGPREVIGVAASVLAAGRPPGRLAENYVEHVLEDVAERVGVRDTGNLAQRAARLDEMARRRGLVAGAHELLRRARLVGQGGAGAQEAVRLGGHAWTYREQMLRKHPAGSH